MKGSLEGVLPMLALLIIATGLGGMSIAIPEGVSSTMEESAGDLSNLAKSKSTSEHIINYYIPDSVEYSANNAAYELGQDNGGVSWNSISTKEDMLGVWESRSDRKVNSRIDSISSDCVVKKDYELDLFPNSTDEEVVDKSTKITNLTIHPDNEFETAAIECKNKNNVVYRERNSVSNRSFGNRYPALINYTLDFYDEAESRYENAEVEDTYTGTDESCPSSPSKSSATDSAFSSYRSDTPTFSTVSSEITKPANTTVSGSTIDSYRESYSDLETTGSCTYDCPGEDEEGSCSTSPRKKWTVRITPTNSQMRMDITTNEELAIKGQYRNLALKVNEYSYSH